MSWLRKWRNARKVAFSDGVIDLFPLNLQMIDTDLNVEGDYVFRISPTGTQENAGQIHLRTGESEGLYYLGHIGYHVNRPYQGNSYALRACRLLIPLCQALGQRSLIITTDVDNVPSRKTCTRLGCILESTVPVPAEFQKRYELSKAKCRYVWLIPERTT